MSPSRALSWKFDWRYAALIFLVALCFRAFYLFEAGGRPDFCVFSMDQQYNLDWARCIASGNWPAPYDRLHNAAFFRAPLYSYSVAAVIALFGDHPLLICILQIIIGSVSCALVYGVAGRCFGQAVGVVTGFFCALYWALAYFDVEFLLTVPLVFFVLLGFQLLFVAVERRNVALAGAAGLAFGLFAVTRADILLFCPVLVLWGIWRALKMERKTAILFVLLLAIGCALPASLVTLRNRIVGGDWVVVASQGGANFYIGNNPQSNGMQAVVPGTRPTWWGGYEDTVAVAEKAAGRKLKPSEVSDYWYRQAFSYMRQQPGHWLKLTLRKTAGFFGGVEIPNNKPYEARRGQYPALKAIPLNFGILFGLFLVSLPRMLWPRRFMTLRGVAGGEEQQSFARLCIAFVAVYSATMIAFFVTGRYRVPVIPFVAMGAAVAIVSIIDLFCTRRFIRGTAMLLTAVLLTCVLNVDFLGIRAATGGWVEFTEAQDRLATGDLNGAIGILENVRKQNTVPVAELYSSLARAYVQRGNPADRDTILEVAEEGLRSHPDTPDLIWYAATVHMERREWKKASELIERYLAQRSSDIPALRVAFFAALFDGRPQDAARHLAAAEASDRTNPAVADMRRQLEKAQK